MALSLPKRASAAWELSWKKKNKHPSTNAGSVKRSDKCSKASASYKHMNYSNCQELWLHDITSSSLLLLKSKYGYLMCRWAEPHNLLCSTICALMDAHRLSGSKSSHLKEIPGLCKQLLLCFIDSKWTEVSDSRLLVSFLHAVKQDVFQSVSSYKNIIYSVSFKWRKVICTFCLSES